MPRDGTATRTRILDSAQALVLERGFGATSVDAVIAGAEVAKGAFFHHFPSKGDLARALVERYAHADAEHFDAVMERAGRLSRDPLQRLLLFVGLMEESAREPGFPTDGCLYASFLYERQLVDPSTRDAMRAGLLRWRERLAALLREIAEVHPPRSPVDLDDVADQTVVLFEGAFVMARALGDGGIAHRQLALHRTFLELLFGVE